MQLHAWAEALELDIDKIMDLAGVKLWDRLPSLGVYLRSTTDLPEVAVAEAVAHLDWLRNKYGLTSSGPAEGEDEAA